MLISVSYILRGLQPVIHSAIDDAAAMSLAAGLPAQLLDLDLGQCSLGVPAVVALLGCSQLHRLRLFGNAAVGAALEPALDDLAASAVASQLRDLDLGGCGLSDG